LFGKLPVYTAVWRDIIVDDYGYVQDEFGQIVLKRLDYIEDGEDKAKYTHKDVIAFTKLSPFQKKVLGGKKAVKKMYVDNWRFCKFIPSEVVAYRDNTGTYKDIVLDHGYIPYQEPDLYRATNMMPPYKVGTWSYLDGVVLSPVDVVINPQRMINRFLSVMENQLNNSGGRNITFDKDMLGSQDEAEFISKINRSEPVGLHGKGRGMQNAISKYDAGAENAAVAYSNLIDTFRVGIEQITGVNDGLKGQSSNPDQLVGVMQLMIQRGSIIQEPFYSALSDIFQGVYQDMVTSARRFYIDNELDLIDAVGEESASVLRLSKDIRNESMGVKLFKSIDPQSERMYVDNKLTIWLQFGLIDSETAGNLMGRASDEEAHMALREFQKQFAEQKRMATQQANQVAQAQSQAQEQAGRVVYGEKVREEVRDDVNKEKDRNTKLAVAESKNLR
jgi:hypothetical protein